MKFPDSLFHYTVGPKLPLILAKRRLEPIGYGLASSKREKPILWFSENPNWEPTATKVISTDGGKSFKRPETSELQSLVGLYRFRLDTRKPEALSEVGIKLIPWARLPALAHIDANDVTSMLKGGFNLGAKPTDWWGIFEPVSIFLEATKILTLESLTAAEDGLSESWIPVGIEQAVAEFEARGLNIRQTKASQEPKAMRI